MSDVWHGLWMPSGTLMLGIAILVFGTLARVRANMVEEEWGKGNRVSAVLDAIVAAIFYGYAFLLVTVGFFGWWK